MALRLAAWNCRMAVDRKRAAIERLGADVVVLPECEREPALARELGVSFAWQGTNRRKGLAVVGFGGWTVTPIESPLAFPWTLPVVVADPAGVERALLVAVWTVAGNGRPSYAAQASALIDAIPDDLSGSPMIIAGDFNASAQLPVHARHVENVTRLADRGTHSAYHHHHAVAHGEEAAMTLRWIGRGKRPSLYHCDFVFLSEPLLERLRAVEVGTIEEWVESGLSDHAPVIVDLELT